MERKKRTCLKCGKLFDSAGPGNRICQRCQQINDRLPHSPRRNCSNSAAPSGTTAS